MKGGVYRMLTFQEMNNFSICRYRLNSGTGRPFLKRKDGYFFPLYSADVPFSTCPNTVDI